MPVKVNMTLRRTSPNAFRWLYKNVQEIKKLNNAGLTVGIHPEDNTREDGKSNADIAAAHEFGLGVPQRSFFRPVLARQAPQRLEINAIYRDGLSKALRGQTTIKAVNIRVGKMMVQAVQKKIDSGVPPANAPLTVARKGHGRTLRDTLQMRNAIKYKVRG